MGQPSLQFANVGATDNALLTADVPGGGVQPTPVLVDPASGNMSELGVISQEGLATVAAVGDYRGRNGLTINADTSPAGGSVGLLASVSGGNNAELGHVIGGATRPPLFTCSATSIFRLRIGTTNRIEFNGTGIGFFATAPVARPTITGSRAGNAALASLLTGLANLGLIVDSTGV